jgi:rhodanese-related sulfurtransferase
MIVQSPNPVQESVMSASATEVKESVDDILRRAEDLARKDGLAYRGQLTPDEAWRVLQEYPGARLVDVRTAEEWALVGRVPGAVEIQWRLFQNWALNPHFLDEIRKNLLPENLILLLCRSGVRSKEAGELLASEGFPNCFNVLEGFEGDKNEAGQRVVAGWKVRGLPWSQ